jgi:hypothetical protein
MGAFALNLVNSPIRTALDLAKFNKLSVEPRGTTLAVVFEQIVQRQRRGRPGCLLQGGAYIIVGRCASHCSGADTQARLYVENYWSLNAPRCAKME